jgi:putative peptidoglycan lipid II flippase
VAEPLREAGVVGSGTLASRLLGLLRDQLFAAFLGAGALADAFQLAFRAPHLLRDLLGEGALSGALTPAIARARERSQEEGSELADRVGLRLLLVVTGVAAALVWLAPFLVGDLTARLFRVMSPFLPLVVLAAVAMSILHGAGHTRAPAFASASFNLATIAVAVGGWLLGARGETAALVWALGTLAGGLAQVAIQLPALRRVGYRPRWRPALTPEAREILRAFLPAVVGLSALQVNLFVAMGFATATPGATSHLAYAFRFVQLPMGLAGVAVGVVSSVAVARAAAAGRDATAETLAGLRLVAFVTLPATMGLWLLAEPIVRLLYERGAFLPEDTRATGRALAALALGMWPHGVVKVAAPALYAARRVRWPLLAAGASIATNTLWCALGGELALGLTLGSAVNALLLLLALPAARSLGRLVAPLLGMTLAAAGCGLAAWLVFPHLGTLPACAAGAVVYAAVTFALRLEEVKAILRR